MAARHDCHFVSPEQSLSIARFEKANSPIAIDVWITGVICESTDAAALRRIDELRCSSEINRGFHISA